jgi:hypothetical protein
MLRVPGADGGRAPRHFKSTAYWNPAVVTDDAGEASVTFDLPSNLTSFRVMAVAQTADSSFGRGDDVFRVTKPLQLQPSMPRFVRAGDRFEAGVVVRNLSEKAGRAILELESSDITCTDAGARPSRSAGRFSEVPRSMGLPGGPGWPQGGLGVEMDGARPCDIWLPASRTVAWGRSRTGR